MSEADHAAPTPEATVLPRPHWSWYPLVALCAGLVALGVYAFYHQTTNDFIVTNLRNVGGGGAPWGLYIVFDVYFVGVSFAGITVAAMARLFNVKVLKPVTRIAELVTIVALLAGGCVIMADLGRPLHGLINLPALARPSSPFFGTFTLVIAGYLFSSLVFFLLSARADAGMMAESGPRHLRWFYRLWASGYRNVHSDNARHRRTSFWLSLTILPLLVTAHSTLGFIFGLQSGRPGWYSSLQAPGFVVLAGVSGTCVVILICLLLRSVMGLKERIPEAGLRWLGNFVWILMAVYLYFMIVEELTATYAGPEADRHVAHEIVTGRYAAVFWVTVACFFATFLIPFLLFLSKKTSMGWLAVTAVLANVGAVLKRFLIVVPSQIEGVAISNEPASYGPNWVEVSIVLGLAGLILLAVLLFARIFPMVPTVHHESHGSPPFEPLRTAATSLWALAATGIMALGLLDSFRLFSKDNIDPKFLFSPVVFASGVMMLFTTAYIYEVFPARQQPRGAMRSSGGDGPRPIDAVEPVEGTEV